MLSLSTFVRLSLIASLTTAPLALAQRDPNRSTGGSRGGSYGGNQGGNNHGGNQGGSYGGNQGGNNHGGNQGGSYGGNQGGNNHGGNQGGNNHGGTHGGNNHGGNHGGNNHGGNHGGNNHGGNHGGGQHGSTHGGSTHGGSTTGGETTGGSTTGGSTTGGETTGGSTTGGGDSSTRYRLRLLPIAFGSYDILNRPTNQTQQEQQEQQEDQEEQEEQQDTNKYSFPVVLDDYKEGFRVSQVRMWNAALGVMPQIYLQNASGLARLSTVVGGLAFTKNRFVQYERIVEDERMVDGLNVLPIPVKRDLLDQYGDGESVYFESTGGIVFFGGIGVGAAYAGGSVTSEGGFKTLINKISTNKAMVQITQTKIRTASLYTGVAVLNLDATKVNELNEGFNYEFDFSINKKDTAQAYEALLTGNMTLAQKMSENGFMSGVKKVESHVNSQITSRRGMSFGIPMIAISNWTSGKIYGETATKYYMDKTQTDMNYGVYFKEEKTRFFHNHMKIIRAFYSAKAVTKNEAKAIVGNNEMATLVWNYENDSGSSQKFRSALELLQADFGIKKSFNPEVPSREKLGFIRLEAKIEIPESYTKTLIPAMTSTTLKGMQVSAQDKINTYFRAGDINELCSREDGVIDTSDACKARILNETNQALGNIRSILANISKKKTAAEYTYHYALMGKELIKNQFVLGSFFSMDKACALKYEVSYEGRRLSKMAKKIPANADCR